MKRLGPQSGVEDTEILLHRRTLVDLGELGHSNASGVSVTASWMSGSASNVVFVQRAGAIVPLAAEMRNAAARYFPGVVAEAVPAFPIDAVLAQPAADTRLHDIVSGDDKGGGEARRRRLPDVQ